MIVKKRLKWESDNGKYSIIARQFDDNTTDIKVSKVVKGKGCDIRTSDLPQYVKSKCEELYSQVNFKA